MSAFILDLHAYSGPRVARLPHADHDLALRKWHTHLRIRSDVTGFVPPTVNPEDDELTGFVPPVFEEDGLALLVTTRDFQDLPGGAAGLYHARVEAAELAALREAVEGTSWVDLPPPSGADVNLPSLQLRYAREGLLIERGFNAGNGEFLAAIAPLWERLDACIERARKRAASTLELSLKLAVDEEDPLRVQVSASLRARGIGHIALADPRVPASPDHPPALRLFVARRVSDNPHAQLVDRVELTLPTPDPHTDTTSETLVLKPNRRVNVELPWHADAPGNYVFSARWEDYAGPRSPARGQTPFMPLPRVGPSSLGAGPYPVRGALFAQASIELSPAPT